jgi:hypothetical protein
VPVFTVKVCCGEPDGGTRRMSIEIVSVPRFEPALMEPPSARSGAAGEPLMT